MDKNKANVPKIRFPGFTDPWEQRKFEDMYKVISGYAFKMSDYIESGVAIINGEAIQHNKIESNNFNYLPESFSAKYSKLILDKGDIVIGLNRPITNGQLKIARIPSELSGSLLYQRAGKIESLQSTYEDFTYTLLDQEILKFTLKEAVGSDQPFISTTKLNKWNFLIPSNINEQEKIGTLFNQLDGTITLHQRKLNHLQDKKKSLLQKMFPKKGEDFPELRFPGFTDPWEQLKASEIFETVSDKNHSELPVISASQKLGMIRRDEIGIDIKYDEKSTKNYKRVKPGQFVIHLRSFQGGFAWSDIEGITSPAYTILDFKEQDKQYPKFWKEELTSCNFIKRLETVTYGIRDGRSISFTDFSTLNFHVPLIDEQRLIGEFFQKFDNLITLHQRKLNHLKEQKKALLQQMFI